jgi:type I phosphodiesterase/nucleotide pyrophosphatase
LDSTGHRYGCGSEHWRQHLVFVDLLVRRLAETLPADAALYVTADHGMIDPGARVDVDAEPALREGVALLGGEPRARHVYAEKGAATSVLETWRERFAGQAWVMSREEAVETGLFGPVPAAMAARVGDVLAIPYTDVAIVATETEPLESRLVGMHGSLVPAEQLVPLVGHVAG